MNRYARPGAQKLRTMRDPQSGRALGILTCSIQLLLGQGPALVVEDVIEGIIVGQVINPFGHPASGKVFLADEVQRAMRLGLARWLAIEMDAQRAVAVEKLNGQEGWRVVFELHLPNAEDALLHVDTPACMADQAIGCAMQEVAGWCQQQSAHPLQADILDALMDADLNGAPWLRAGLALMEREIPDVHAPLLAAHEVAHPSVNTPM